MQSYNGEVLGSHFRWNSQGTPMWGGDFYTEASNDKKEPARGRSRGDAAQAEETENAKAPQGSKFRWLLKFFLGPTVFILRSPQLLHVTLG